MEKILIIGGTGFIGQHLVNTALERGLNVHITYRNKKRTATLPANVTKHEFEISNEDKIRQLIVDYSFDYIIQNIGITKAKSSNKYYAANANFVRKLGKILIEEHCIPKKLLFISSLSAYGPAEFSPTNIISDQFPPHPLTVYGKSKLQGEHFLIGLKKIPYLILRPTVVYGPGDKELFPILKLLNKGLGIHLGPKNQMLSFIYVKDLANLTITALLSEYEQKSYFVASNGAISTTNFYETIGSIFQKKIRHFSIPKSVLKGIARILHFIAMVTKKYPMLNSEKVEELTATSWECDVTQIEKDFEFVPLHTLKSGMKETVQWAKDEKLL